MQDPGHEVIRRRLVCRGVVQGVGFRPAVWRFGHALGLGGFVRNDEDGATIEVQGPAVDVATFERELPQRLPPLARLAGVQTTSLPPLPQQAAGEFVIATTARGDRGAALVPPDTALCSACRQELDDPADRRHRHPFTNCTDCGPRFSLVRALPYDRERTAMACFPLCPRCAAEYGDPASRRFHAEPICCPDCGPQAWLVDADGELLGMGAAALARARQLLADGAIVAIKGLGGFQLACRADRPATVALLRARKQRPTKPLAVMAKDLATARRLVELQPADEALLTGPIGPIVLAPRRADADVAEAIAPGIADLGVLLPTTPLHHELFRGAAYTSLVATSGNHSDEPICLGNREARARLVDLADALLLHDRDIVRRVDDSVVRSAPDAPIVVRRSRGYVPAPLPLPFAAPTPVLALGGHLQNTACVAVGEHAFVSQHVGDLDAEAARAFLREVACGIEEFLGTTATTIACDTHPDYASSWLAEQLARARAGRVVRVPHHLGHAAAVLAEHGAFPTATNVATALVLDGTGHGADAAAWGAELLQFDATLRWSRVAWGAALPLVGGEVAVREPWRIAVAVLTAAGLRDELLDLPLAVDVDRRRVGALAELCSRNVGGWPLAHGAGRLFEAAGALLGACPRNHYEGEAAARLEAIAARWPDPVEPWPEVQLPADRRELPQPELLVAAARRWLAGEDVAAIAAGLHATYAARWVELLQRSCRTPATLALAGGCLVNRLLRRELRRHCQALGVATLQAIELPPGDGGLAYGQAVVAAAAVAHGTTPTFVPFPVLADREEAPCVSPSRCN